MTKYLLIIGLFFLTGCTRDTSVRPSRLQGSTLRFVGEDKERGVACYDTGYRGEFSCVRIK